MLAPVGGEFGLARLTQGMVKKTHAAAAGHVQSPQNVQQGGFATAGGAPQNDGFAPAYLQIDVAQGVHLHIAAAVDLAQSPRYQHRGI